MADQNQITEGQVYDVAICGGGLAGLTLARQLKVEQPQRSVVLIDRLARPLPEAAFKVGESTVELGAFYLRETLNLPDYFETHHFRKLGLRFFFGDAQGPFHERPEFGLSAFPGVSSYQLDRGLLENDLRQFNAEAGVELLEGVRVQDVFLAPDGHPHEISLQAIGSSNPPKIQARWVVDATGRRRLLQKKLGLTRPGKKQYSSIWFRVNGRLDINDFVSADHRAWHARVPDRLRYYSTNHLMGAGYWIWIIPLSTDFTSVGIVVNEEFHPFDGLNTYERASRWFEIHEPTLAAHLENRPPVDFKCMRSYNYSSQQVFSAERWACVGEAGVFADPFYSPGTDLIGFGNSTTSALIKQDFAGELTSDRVTDYNRFLIGYSEALAHNIHLGYPFFGNALVTGLKIIWDTAAAWGFACPQMFNSIYLDAEQSAQVRRVTAPFFYLTRRVQRLFVEWGAKSSGRLSFEFLEYLTLDFLSELRSRNLQTGKDTATLVADQAENMDRIEELAQVLFLLALEDVMPEHLDRFPEPVWVNAWRISLDPERWEKDDLFQPKTEPRDFREMRAQIRAKLYLKDAKEAITDNRMELA